MSLTSTSRRSWRGSLPSLDIGCGRLTSAARSKLDPQSRPEEVSARVFVSGASGAIGRRLLAVLVEAGHAVVTMTPTPAKDALRTDGTRIVADASGAQRVVAQSIAFAYEPAGDRIKDEDPPLYAEPPPELRRSAEAISTLEQRTGFAACSAKFERRC